MFSPERILEKLSKYQPEQIIFFNPSIDKVADEPSFLLGIVIIKETNKRFRERLLEASEIIGPDIEKTGVLVYTPQEWNTMLEEKNPFVKKVAETGQVVYTKR